MDWQAILLWVVGIVLTTLVTWLSERLIAFLNAKISNVKYAKCLGDSVSIVISAVKSTYQTYVQALKDKNMFTEDAQKEALNRAKNIALTQLSQDLKLFITTNFGDIETWIQETVESSLYDLKNQSKKETVSE